jgi:hypothetical protein
MSLKLKVLGLGVLAIMAMSAFAAISASAKVAGHFTHEGTANHVIVKGEESFHTSHFLQFQHTNSEGKADGKPIECTEAKYEGTAATKTVTVIQMTAAYSGCRTQEGAAGEVSVTMNGCSYTFFSGGTKHGTVAVDCPVGSAIEVHHPNCTITIGAQTPTTNGLTNGVSYTTTVEGKHALTANVTVGNIAGQYHGGICIFLGTPQNFDMNGSVTIKGFNTDGTQAGITHT